MKSVAIYGAGSFGQYVYSLFCDSELYKVCCFIDNNKSRGFDYKKDTPVVTIKGFKNEWADECDLVLIATSFFNINQEMVISLLPWYKGEIRIVDHNVFSGKLNILDDDCLNIFARDYKEIKPILNYVEYDVTTFCNLKCKNCGHKSDLVKEMNQGDKEEYKKSLLGLKKIFSNIETFRIMGGEPFLVKDLDWYIEALREVFPKTQIHIVSNGLLIPTVSEKVISVIRSTGVTIDISQYPPTKQVIKEILNRLNENEIISNVSAPIQLFMKRDNNYAVESSKIETTWQNCFSRKCHSLRDGYLMPCGMVYQLTHDDNKIIDDKIFHECAYALDDCNNDGWEIIRNFNMPFSLCRFCSYHVEWETWNRID